MQAAIFDFPSSATMPITEKRFNKLEERVNAIGERLANIEGAIGVIPKQQSKSARLAVWLPIGAPVATLIVIVVTVAIHFDNKLENRIGALQKDVQGYSIRLGKVEDAVKVLSSQQSDQTQKLVHDLLSAAKSANSPVIAARAAQAAASLVATLREEKRPASPQFFQAAIEDLNRLAPTIKQAAFGPRIAVAEYRSKLNPPPPIPETVATTPFPIGGVGLPQIYVWDAPVATSKIAGLDGGGAVVRRGHLQGSEPYRDMLLSDSKRWEVNRTVIMNLTLMDGVQSLDGYIWENVIFFNMHIHYTGGTTKLHNVRFVNCTFDLPASDNGTRIADYAALGNTGELDVG